MNKRTPATLWLGGKDLAVFVAYIGMLCVAIHFYQPWEDEGVAWMIARLFPICTMLFHILRYQGHPCLWYLLLWGPAHLHMPYVYINWISAVIASAGTYVLLRFSPFPFYLRALIPFGFFLGYQYAIVARSYVLFPVLGFTVAHIYRQRHGYPVAMAVVLALLANVSIHGTIVATSFAGLYILKLVKQQQSLERIPLAGKNALLGATLFAASLILVGACIWPPRDLNPEFSSPILKLLEHKINMQETPAAAQHAVLNLREHAQPDPRYKTTSYSDLRTASDAERRPWIVGVQWNDWSEPLFYVLRYSFAASTPFALFYQALTLVYLYRANKILLIVPAVLLVLFLLVVFSQLWHLGLIWVTLLMVIWAAWDSSLKPDALNLQNAVAGTLGLLCVLQLPWTINAIRYERHHSTYPAGQAAAYLETLPRGTRMDQLGLGFTVLPYFSRNIFVAHGEPAFSHSETSDPSARIAEVLATGPDVIVADDQNSHTLIALQAAGYQVTHSFCGAPYFPNASLGSLCLLVFERD